MDVLRAERLNRIIEAEDRARALRNKLKGFSLAPMSKAEGHELADLVAQGLQAIREEL